LQNIKPSYSVFQLGALANGDYPDLNKFVLYNSSGVGGIGNFKLFYSNNDAAKTDVNHASWTAITNSDTSSTSFSAADTTDAQTFNLDSVASAKYFKLQVDSRQDNVDTYTYAYELQLSGTKTVANYYDNKRFTATSATSAQTFDFDSVASAKYFKLQVDSRQDNVDTYTYAYELQLSGTKTVANY
jgi:hypothetical protein